MRFLNQWKGQAAQLTEATVSNRTARKNLERSFMLITYFPIPNSALIQVKKTPRCWCAMRN